MGVLDEALGYDDVCLIPQFSEIMSRSDPDTSTWLAGAQLRTPIVSANMDTVSGPDMCIAMRKAGGYGALHRFMTIEQNVAAFKQVRDAFPSDPFPCFVTIGVTDDWEDRAAGLYELGARNFIIDIAHGHSWYMRRGLDMMRRTYGSKVTLMGGNVATPKAVRDLVEWGANVVKVGIGGGSVCKTRVVTGHGVPMFTTVLECAEMIDKAFGGGQVKVVADGGLRSSGDICKAFAAGVDAVMAGSLLAGTDETPELVSAASRGQRPTMCDFRGMASSAALRDRGFRAGLAPEGVSVSISRKGPVASVLSELTAGLRSGMSYCGAMALDQIAVKARWRRQSHAGHIEGTPHILRGT